MGIQVEFNPDLALRGYSEFKKGNRAKEECLPEKIEAGKEYSFLKRGQRNYWLHGELPLLEAKGSQQLSAPLAGVIIKEVVHFLKDREVWTKGKYKIVEVFPDTRPRFNGFAKI
ncbi:MAG: hypothetical protein HYV68_00070 [Candidatus Taylorbacteria bacterium]|nr:hypothetical protein [Candidatus Taylorbacteria bacterium]